MGLGKVNRKELTLIADVLPMQLRSRNQNGLAGGSGHAVGEFCPSEQPSRCSSSQISPGLRTHATSASGRLKRATTPLFASRSASVNRILSDEGQPNTTINRLLTFGRT